MGSRKTASMKSERIESTEVQIRFYAKRKSVGLLFDSIEDFREIWENAKAGPKPR
jgi:hypothetical protein